MPNVAEPGPQPPAPIDRSGCESAALLLPGAALPACGARVDSTSLSLPFTQSGATRARSALEAGLRGAWHGAKRFMPDALFLSLSHWRHVGRWPNLVKPRTFNEFILRRCLHPEPQWSMLADKLAVREFVKQRIGEAHLIPLIATPDVFDRALYDCLPNAFVMKANHGCGYVKIVDDKRQTSFDELNRLAQQWLAEDFYRASRERHYRAITPRLYFEQLLLDQSGHVPADLKLNMFGRDANGEPIIYAGIVSDRFGTPHGDVFDVHWNRVDIAVGHYPRSAIAPPAPPHWDEIVRLATRLADGLGYVRVDLYVPDGKILFGELTFTPGAGVFPFHPDRIDYEWGRLFEATLDNEKRNGRKYFKQGSTV